MSAQTIDCHEGFCFNLILQYMKQQRLFMKMVLEASFKEGGVSAFPLLSKLIKYYSTLCKILLTIIKLYLDYNSVI